MTAHWGIEDPAAVEGPDIEKQKAFNLAFRYLKTRISLLLATPIHRLDRTGPEKPPAGNRRGGRRNPRTQDGSLKVTIIIYHNPACGTSRNTLAMIRQSGEEPVVIEYLKEPPTRERLVELLKAMGISARELLRQKGTPYEALGLADPKWTDDELIGFMLEHPILINRPIVVTPKGVRLCRPSEVVLDILPNPDIGDFTKEDGEVVSAKGAQSQS